MMSPDHAKPYLGQEFENVVDWNDVYLVLSYKTVRFNSLLETINTFSVLKKASGIIPGYQ